MPIQWTFRPPSVNAVALVHAVAKVAEHAGAEALLAASRPEVPVDTGRLQGSGRVTDTAHGAVVGYGFEDGDGTHAPTAAYAVIQHESLENNHPNGGSAKYLEKPMHSAHPEVLAAEAAVFRKIFGA